MTESYERTLRRVVVSGVQPPVFGLTVARLGGEGNRALAVVVPPSVDAPYLVYRGECFDARIGLSGAENILDALEMVSFAIFAALAVICLISLLLRLRGAESRTRRQIGTLGAGVAVLAGLFLLDSTLQGMFGDVYGVLGAVVATSAVPIAAALALLAPTTDEHPA